MMTGVIILPQTPLVQGSGQKWAGVGNGVRGSIECVLTLGFTQKGDFFLFCYILTLAYLPMIVSFSKK